MPTTVVNATRPPVLDDRGLMDIIEEGVKLSQANSFDLTDKHLELWIDFLTENKLLSQCDIEEQLLTPKGDNKFVFLKKSIDILQDRLDSVWSKHIDTDYVSPNWEFRFQERNEVNKDREHGFLMYRDTPYCWHLPIHHLPDPIKPVILTMLESANELVVGVNSFCMSQFMDYIGGGIMEEMEIIDKAGALEMPMENALKVERTLEVIEEYLEFRCCDDPQDGWNDLKSWYLEIKDAKGMVNESVSEVKPLLEAYKQANSNGGDFLILDQAMELLSNNRPYTDKNGSRACFERLEQEWFDDEIHLCDMDVSTISFLKFDFDNEFDQSIQVEWENGAIFGGFLSLESNKPEKILKRLDEIALGVTILTMIEIFVDQLISEKS